MNDLLSWSQMLEFHKLSFFSAGSINFIEWISMKHSCLMWCQARHDNRTTDNKPVPEFRYTFHAIIRCPKPFLHFWWNRKSEKTKDWRTNLKKWASQPRIICARDWRQRLSLVQEYHRSLLQHLLLYHSDGADYEAIKLSHWTELVNRDQHRNKVMRN